MKLYTEEQVRQMLSIYMANVLLDVDGKMPTIDDILSYRIPIELPSDEEITQNLIIQELYSYATYEGAIWMKEQILNQNK